MDVPVPTLTPLLFTHRRPLRVKKLEEVVIGKVNRVHERDLEIVLIFQFLWSLEKIRTSKSIQIPYNNSLFHSLTYSFIWRKGQKIELCLFYLFTVEMCSVGRLMLRTRLESEDFVFLFGRTTILSRHYKIGTFSSRVFTTRWCSQLDPFYFFFNDENSSHFNTS